MKKAKSRQSDFRTRKDSSKKKHHWFRTILVFLLLLVGLALVFNRSIRNSVIAWNTNKYQVSKVDKKTLTKNKKAKVNYDFDSVKSVSAQSVISSQMDAQDLPVIGGIAIPDLELNLPIFKGLGNTELSYGAGTMKENQVMGGTNNYALASHHVFGVNGASKMLFSPLDNAKNGMEIYLTDKNKIYTYTISEVKTVNPSDVAVIDDTPGAKTLTLVTCDDAEASHRIIVSANYKDEVSYDKASQKMIDAFNRPYNQLSL
ncbi:class A sortase [Streptococcus sobrinus]|uniref:Sortase n=1 Tax=Streptococcus sobrinus TaxID=1310 RepID=D1MQ01_9STRE|nr:class A sortase [Streptococcus sobrinus]AWN20644.1 class A sortase [Streptococcus sobrinus]EMP72333.1 sortase [Streptococcus sobrinus DSM 20742 = ATCC 33478]BAI50578.1 sortase [Streptococcus sobrinus]SQG13399.1 sortase [Streptococcus sobrinus]